MLAVNYLSFRLMFLFDQDHAAEKIGVLLRDGQFVARVRRPEIIEQLLRLFLGPSIGPGKLVFVAPAIFHRALKTERRQQSPMRA